MVGKPKLTDYPAIVEIAKAKNATPAQILIAWGAYRGYSVIPKSVQEERIKSNFQQVTLTKEEYEAISAVGKGNHTRYMLFGRYISTMFLVTLHLLDSTFHIITSPDGTSTSLESRRKRTQAIQLTSGLSSQWHVSLNRVSLSINCMYNKYEEH